MAVVWSWKFNGNKDLGNVAFDDAEEIKDEYMQRLLKAVPVAAVGFVTAATAIANVATGNELKLALGAVFAFGLFLAWLEMTRQRKASGQELYWALAAYVIWSYANGGFFAAMGFWYPVLAGLVALGFAALLKFFPAPTK